MAKEYLLPPRPEEPLSSDCCGSGCVPCVQDIYDNELKLWERQCEEIQNQNAGQQSTDIQKVISPDSYKSCVIISVLTESPAIKRFRFALGSHEKLPLKAGQHLVMRWSRPEGSITRQYTPISDYSEAGYFDISIKIYTDGRMSDYVRTWEIGSLVEWRGPFGEFQYIPNKYEHLYLLAAGTGIAPMVQVIRHVLGNEDDETVIHLLYSVTAYGQVMCRDLMDHWKEFWNFDLTYFVTKEKKEQVQLKYGDKVVFGRIDKDTIERKMVHAKDSSYFCICGTKSFDKDMVKTLKLLDIPEDNYHKF